MEMLNPLKSKKFLFYWLPVCAYAGLIFYFSSQSVVPTTQVTPEIPDWALHMTEYAVLGLLLFRAFGKSENLPLGALSGLSKILKVAILATLVAGVYGMTDEMHQYFVPGREMSAADAFADFLGCAVAVVAVALISSKFGSKLEPKLAPKFKFSKLHF